MVTKGALTNGAVYTEASGFLGTFLKFCGFDIIIVQGAAEKSCYLYVYDGGAELRDATHLTKKDTWETESLIKEDLGTGELQSSVFSIGPAGENLVKLACLVGDKGHVAAHNGVGAVLGSKNLKAIAVARGKGKVILSDGERFSILAKNLYEKATGKPGASLHKWGTMGPNSTARSRMLVSRLPIKNQTTNLWPEAYTFSEETVRSQPNFKLQWHPCWACRFIHCHLLEITDGPFAGYKGEEPEYELWAGFAPLIGNTDWAGAAVLSNDVDRLGMDGNEGAWLVAWMMECYEKGLITRETTGGLELNWGNVEAARALLQKIACREGLGDVLAEGVMRAAEHLGGEAQKLAVYTRKGNTPRMHDHRASWAMILDTVTSDRGRDMDTPIVISSPVQVGLPADLDFFTPDGAATLLARVRGRNLIPDIMVICKFNVDGASNEDWAELVSAATGWDYTGEEIQQVALRIVHLIRLFNIRHGHTRELDYPSPRYSSAPIDGVNQGKTIAPVWDETLERYYELMGWDKQTGEPLPETLSNLGL